MGGFWVHDDDEAQRARDLLADYQAQRLVHQREGFVRTPLVDKQIPEQAKELGISEEEVISKVMLKNTVDGQFTTVEDVSELAVHLAAFPSAALTGQSIVVSHGWHMQ